MLDTTVLAEGVAAGGKPAARQPAVDVDVQVNRNTWVRTRDANVEIFSDGPVHVRRQRVGAEPAALALTGVIATERGEYRLFSKRFQVGAGRRCSSARRRSTRRYSDGGIRGAAAGREAVNIRIVMGGTLQRLAHLARERRAAADVAERHPQLSGVQQGDGVTARFRGLAAVEQVGQSEPRGVTKTAGRRLASVALGLAVDEVEGEAGRDLGVDVINITPEDVPTDFGLSGVQDFLLGTRLEVGKYVNPRTFVALYGRAPSPERRRRRHRACASSTACAAAGASRRASSRSSACATRP